VAGILVNNGESVALQLLVGKETVPENLVLRLFGNDYTPTGATVAGDLTEMGGGGYASIELDGASWTVSGTDPTLIAYPQQTFTFTGDPGEPAYGYYLTRLTSLDLIVAERFSDGPYNPTVNGDMVKVTARITATYVGA